jgi:ABC-2 type transport system ATP-binding protein
MTEPFPIHTVALTKSYGQFVAVDSLNLAVPKNRITAFLGPNGAGKSTTIKMLLGMIRPTTGDATVLGHAVANPTESRRLRERIAYVAEDKPLYGYMTVGQLIRFTSRFYPDWWADEAQRLLAEYRLPLQKKVRSLSKGMRTKLALLLAFARRPELLILDEPSEGLDPLGIEELLLQLVSQAAAGVTVFFSSHQLAEVERVADHVCILNHGRLQLSATIDDLRQSYRRIDFVFEAVPSARELIIPGIEKIRSDGCQVTVLTSRNADEVIRRARDLSAVSIEVSPIPLREIFLETVKEPELARETAVGLIKGE